MTANIITTLRILLLIPLYWLLASGKIELRWWAVGVFLAAGLTDIVDGWLARRLNQTSAFGAMLDLIADRLLTLTAVAGLLVGGGLGPLAALAGVILIARDAIVSALNEALPGKLAIRVTTLERVKVAFQIVGLAVLMAPPGWSLGGLIGPYEFGQLCLVLAAGAALVTLVDYVGRALKAFRS